MREYAFTVFQKVLAITLILSMVWPDVARCMEDDKDDFPKSNNPSISINLLKENISDQKGDLQPIDKKESLPSIILKKDKASSEDLKNVDNQEILLEEETNDNSSSKKTNISEKITNKDENSSTPVSSTVNSTEINIPFSENEEVIFGQVSLENKTENNNNTSHEPQNEEEKKGTNLEKILSQMISSPENKEESLKKTEGGDEEKNLSENPSQVSKESDFQKESIKLFEKKEESSSGEKTANSIKIVEEEVDNDSKVIFVIEEKQDDKKEENKNNKKDEPLKQPSQENLNLLSLNEVDEDDFLILNSDNFGSKLELSLLQGGNVQEDLLKETLAEKVLRLLKVKPQNFTNEELEDFDKIMKVEGTWRNHLVWSNLEILIHKALFALTTNKHAVNQKKQKKACAPLWLHGGPLPLEDKSAIKRNLILKTAGNALEEGILEPLNALLLAGMGYQIYDLIKTHKFDWSLKFLANFYFNKTDTTSYIALFNTLDKHPALFGLLGIPLAFTAVKTAWSMFHISQPTEEGVTKSIKAINDRSLKWDSRIFSAISVLPLVSFFLMFHPTKSDIPSTLNH